MQVEPKARGFYGWRVVKAAFVLAAFGWGIGFYGPPVFLSVTTQTTGWSIGLVSAAISCHFLIGAITSASLPAMHRRLGTAAATKVGAVATAVGIVAWAAPTSPWQLFAAAALSGLGWGTMSAAALNLIVAPWFDRARPAALSMAYNGATVSGIVFAPLWVAAIAGFGFAATACAIGIVTVLVICSLAQRVFTRTPQSVGTRPDGDALDARPATIASPTARPLPGRRLWCDRTFQTLAAGMALGLFAQIGLMAHLYSLLVPAFGAQAAGAAMALIALVAIAARTLLGYVMQLGVDRRLIAVAGYAAQLAGALCFMAAAGTNVSMLIAGVVLFGIGFGNATSLPPLVAQVEFVAEDVQRVTALIVGISQLGYAFAPLGFGLIREHTTHAGMAPGEAPAVFAAAALVQALALLAFLHRRR